MFLLLATTKCKRQQIAILIISFFSYVSGIRNEGNNMLLQQEKLLLQQQQSTTENSNNESSENEIRQQSTLNFRPSKVIDFTPADAAIPQRFKPTYMHAQHSTASNTVTLYSNNNKNGNNFNNNIPQKQETQNVNRRYTSETAAAYASAAEKQFSFPNEQQQIPQHLTDKPIYIYRDPFTNENYHYTPTETNVRDIIISTTYNHKNYNNSAYKQQNSHRHHQHDDNQEYLVQSSMKVGTQKRLHQQQETNPFRPYMSLPADEDVYLKHPGVVYDEKSSYNHPNALIDKKSEANKISYDSHDYPPPSYFQQQTSNFLPTPVPAQPSTPRPVIRPSPSPTPPMRQDFRQPLPTQTTIYGQQRPQQQYLQSSQSTMPNYANSIDKYLLNKQQTSDYYRTEVPPQSFHHYQQQQSQREHQYENWPPNSQHDSMPPQLHKQHHQYLSRPSNNFAEIPYPQYETARPPPDRPSYNNYYSYQIGEIPPPETSSPPSQQFSYPNPRPSPQYPYQGPYRPQPSPHHQHHPSGLATLAQYAPQFASLLLGGGAGGGAASNTNGPLSRLIGALTGAANSQQSSSSSLSPSPSSSSYNRRPVNSQLIKALENIAHNDDLQCVPKVLCQMIAAQTQRGQLPTFVTSPAITNFLADFPAASPALIYGRAALLGLSGGEKSCHQTYVKCPKDEYEIIDYLNNHRGGFFKFFSEPEEQQQSVNPDSTQQGATSLFSILSALTGVRQATTTTPRPTPTPQAPALDITSGIQNFFTQLLSDYMGGGSVEYQRRFKRRTKRAVDDKIKFEGESEGDYIDMVRFQDEHRESHRDVFSFKEQDFAMTDDSHRNNEEDFHDEEDEEDTQQVESFDNDDKLDYEDNTERGILYKTLVRGNRFKFFPEMRKENSDEIYEDQHLRQIIKKFNDSYRERKLKFPSAADENSKQSRILNVDKSLFEQKKYGDQFNNYEESTFDDFQNKTQKIKFIDNDEEEDNEGHATSFYSNYLKKPKKTVAFPERESKILTKPYYAASYLHDYLQQDQSDQDANIIFNDQRPLTYEEFPSTSGVNVHNAHVNFVNAQENFSSNTAANNNIYVPSSAADINSNSNHFLPTPSPLNEDYASSNSIYSTKDYSNQDDILKQNAHHKPHKYPLSSFSSTSSFNGGSNNFYKPQYYTANKETNFDRYHSSLYTTKRPNTSAPTTSKSHNNNNIYVTNSQGVTEYYITPDGRKVYL